MSRKSWRCFHCGDLFTNPRHAAEHFGIDQFQTPGCVAVLRDGENHLLKRILELEYELLGYRHEDSDIIRWQMAKNAEHATELRCEGEKGYARGLADGRKLEDAI